MEYQITCHDCYGQKRDLPLDAYDDVDVRVKYRDLRRANPGFSDWRVWKKDKDGKRVLVAANEG